MFNKIKLVMLAIGCTLHVHVYAKILVGISKIFRCQMPGMDYFCFHIYIYIYIYICYSFKIFPRF